MLALEARSTRPARRSPWGTAGGWALVVALGVAAAPTAGGAGADREVGTARLRSAMERRDLRTLDGRPVTLDGLQGEVVVLNFWASWCGPCRKELPRLDVLHTELAARHGRVLAVSVDQDARNARRFVERYRLRLPVVHDGPDGLADALALPHLPFTVVLDRAGEVAFTTHGADEASLAALAERVRRLAATKALVSDAEEGGSR